MFVVRCVSCFMRTGYCVVSWLPQRTVWRLRRLNWREAKRKSVSCSTRSTKTRKMQRIRPSILKTCDLYVKLAAMLDFVLCLYVEINLVYLYTLIPQRSSEGKTSSKIQYGRQDTYWNSTRCSNFLPHIYCSAHTVDFSPYVVLCSDPASHYKTCLDWCSSFHDFSLKSWKFQFFVW